MAWWNIVYLLSVFGFLREFRPSEPFISPYLNGPWKNFTETQITQDIFPIGTYSSTILLIAIFLLTDWLKYKPILCLQGISGVATWTLLTWGQGVPMMQVVQFLYGLFSACDVAYFSYLYAKIEKKFYQKATAIVKAALLAGKATSGFVAQFLVMFNWLDYEELNYITLAGYLIVALGIASLWSLCLSPVSQSTYFHRPRDYTEVSQKELDLDNKVVVQRHSLKHMLTDFQAAMRDKQVLKWSIWWAVSMCGYLQVTFYMQLLWQDIINDKQTHQNIYHGFSNSLHSLVGAMSSYGMGYVKVKWAVFGELALSICALLQGALLVYSSYNNSLITGYTLYIVYRILYQASNTITLSEIAKNLNGDRYALIFGFNTFVALVCQSILTAVVIDFFELDIRSQFTIYGGYYIVIGIGFAVAGILTVCKSYTMCRPETEQNS